MRHFAICPHCHFETEFEDLSLEYLHCFCCDHIFYVDKLPAKVRGVKMPMFKEGMIKNELRKESN